MGRVVLVTGVSRDLGRRLARRCADDPAVERVIGVDVVPPRGDIGAVSFVRADIRHPVIAKVVARERVDTVVHMGVVPTAGVTGGRGTAKELNVIGTMQLLAACQKAPAVRQLVVRSTTTVYGCSSRDPAMWTEEMDPRRLPRSGYAKDASEVEGYVRGFARRRPDVTVTTLRCANVLGAGVASPLAAYLRLPVVPRVLGHDPRLQFLHEDDLLAVLGHAVRSAVGGTFNVAGDGVLVLSQVLRRLQRASVPVPGFALSGLGSVVRQAGLSGISPEFRDFLTYGRGVDTTRMRTVLGFTPTFTTAQTLVDFGARAGSPLAPVVTAPDRVLAGVAERLEAPRG